MLLRPIIGETKQQNHRKVKNKIQKLLDIMMTNSVKVFENHSVALRGF